MGFFDIFTGGDKTLSNDKNQMGSLAGFSTNVGENDTNAASKHYLDLLSGDPTKIAEAVSPETSAAQSMNQQAKNNLAMFSPRSGGTAAAAAGMDANTRAQIINMINRARENAAAGAAQLGTANLGLAQQGVKSEAELSQERMQNWMNSILGKGISSAISSAESFGMGKMGM